MPSAANQSSSPSPAAGSAGSPPARPRRQLRWWLRYACLAALIAVLFGGRTAAGAYLKSMARHCIAQRDPRAALDWLQWCQRLSPNDPEAEFLRARAHRKLGEFNVVRDHLARAFKLGYSVDKLEREQILAQAQAGQLAEAEPHFAGLLTRPDGDEAEICEAIVNGMVLNRRIASALELLTPWIADFPDSPQPYYIRGHIQKELMRFKLAEADLRKAHELDPQHAATQFELAEVLDQLHQPEAALAFYEMAEKSPSVEMLAGVGRSRCLKILGRPDESRAVISKVLEKYPSEPLPHQTLGQIEVEAGNYQEALKHLDIAVKKLGYDSELRNARGTALRGLKQIDAARKEFEYVNEAGQQMRRQHDLREKILANPDDYEVRFEIGKILLKYSDPREGVIWLQSVFNYQPRHKGAHTILAEYYESRSKEDPAFEKLAKMHRQEADATLDLDDETKSPEVRSDNEPTTP